MANTLDEKDQTVERALWMAETFAMSKEFTRRRLLALASAGATYLALANTVGCELRIPKVGSSPNFSPNSVWKFRSRPDLDPPVVNITTRVHDTAPGYIFIAPKWGGAGQGGPMILDNSGQVVWFRPTQDAHEAAMDLKVQNYRGKPVLTWGEDEYVIADISYREIARVRAGNGI